MVMHPVCTKSLNHINALIWSNSAYSQALKHLAKTIQSSQRLAAQSFDKEGHNMTGH